MPIIDDKIVAASFESDKFESGVKKTLSALNKLKEALHFPEAGKFEAQIGKTISTLDKLKGALHLPGASKGLEDISLAAKKVDLSHVSRGLEDVSSKLSAFDKQKASFRAPDTTKFETSVKGTTSILDRFRAVLDYPYSTKFESGFNSISSTLSRFKDMLGHPFDKFESGFRTTVASFDKFKEALRVPITEKIDAGVGKTTSLLDKLKGALQFPGASKGLASITEAAKHVNFNHIDKGIEGINSKLGALRLTAIATFSQLATRAIAAGGRIAKQFTIDPLTTGFQEYSTGLNSVQTILANTQASGATLDDVNKALLTLNKYSDQTIYNFGQMARNIGTFTAAGVDLDTSVQSIKGIANLAALSGSNSEQASTAMYQLSQAISAGRVGLQDWNSVVNAGMGGTVFQRALATTAESMGQIKKGALKLVGPMKNVSINGESFRQSMQAKPGQESWLTSKVLTQTLKQFTGDLSDAELKAQGFNDTQIKAIQQTAQTAKHAATEVKTISQVLDVAKETAGSGWAQTWQIIFGNFGEAKGTFTALSNTINGFINKMSESRNKLLSDWKDLGGRAILINSLKTAFKALGEILAPIKKAFHEFFPATTGKQLLDLTKKFQDFAEAIRPSTQTLFYLRRTFRGLFAVLDIGWEIVKGVVGVFKDLADSAGIGGGGFLLFIAKMGNSLVKLHEWLIEGGKLNKFFKDMTSFLKGPVKFLNKLTHAMAGMFDSGGAADKASTITGNFTQNMKAMSGAASGFGKILDAVAKAFDKIGSSLSGGNINLDPVLNTLVDFFQKIGPAIGKATANINWELVFAGVRTGIMGGFLLIFKGFLGNGSFLKQLGGEGYLSKLTLGLTGKGGLFGSLTGSMKSMQNNVRADTLKKIAIALLLLTVSVVALSFVDPDRLKSSLTAITVMFGQLLGAMAILDKISSTRGMLKLPFIAGSMILFAAAIDILTIAVIALGKQDPETLKKGLISVTILLGALSAAAIPLSMGSKGMITAGIGITALAVGMKILAGAVAELGKLKLTELAKGLGGIAIALGIIVATMRVMPKSIFFTGPALVILATGLKILAGVVKTFGSMDWNMIHKGMVGLGASLFVIAAAMHLMPKSLPVTAAGLILLSVGLKGIASVIKSLGGMSPKEMAKGIAALGGSLGVLVVALRGMQATAGGTFALSTVVGALSLLVPAIILLGKQSWRSIIKSLITLAGALGIIAGAAILMAPAAPALLAFGAALILVGAGLTLTGLGLALIAGGISALVVSIPLGIGILVGALIELYKTIPELVKNVVAGLLVLVRGIAKAAPEFLAAIVKILGMILVGIVKVTPKLVKALESLLKAAIKFLHENGPKMIQAGLELLLNLLKGIRDNIAQIVKVVADLIVRFLDSVSEHLGKIVAAGAGILIALLKGIGDSIGRVVTTVGNIIVKFIQTIAGMYNSIIKAGFDVLVHFLTGISDNLKRVVTAGADIIVSFIKGIGSAAKDIIVQARKTAKLFMDTIATEIPKFVNDVFEAIIKLMNGLADVIDKRAPELRKAGRHLGWAIIDGITLGLAGHAEKLYDKAKQIAGKTLHIISHPWDAHSPSRTMQDLGRDIILGLVKGLDDYAKDAFRSAEIMSYGVLGAVTNIFKNSKSGSGPLFEIGQLVGGSFAEGLRGSLPEVETASNKINDAFVELYAKVNDSITSVTADIVEKNKKLTELQNNKQTKENAAAIASLTKEINAQYDVLHKLNETRIVVTTTLTAERIELNKLSVAYDKINAKLDEQKTKLTELKQARKAALDSYTNEFNTLPGLSAKEDAEGVAVDQLATYKAALDAQIKATVAYKSTLDQLRKLGLDDATYKKLLEEGTGDQAFADQLLSGGKTAVDSLNTLDKQLLDVSTTLATNSANNLFNAGIKSQEGLVKGLERDRNKLRAKIEELGHDILTTIKRVLKIKSPSEAMAEIGRFAMEGLIKGLSSASSSVTNGIERAADNALSRTKKLIRDMSAAIYKEMDSNPVITPVLDLTQFRRQARELGALNAPIAATASQIQAQQIAADHQRVGPSEELATPAPVAPISFIQNNNSPEALSNVEIFRQTNNALSRLKAVVAPA